MKYKILIAEDNKEISDILKLYLEAEGNEVIIFNNGLDALLYIKKEKIDLAILDIMMPKMDGYELTKEIRKISNMPIIILSAKSEDNDKIIGLNIGADDYVAKPFNPLEIIARVNALLRRTYKLGEKDNTILKLGQLTLDINKCKLFKNSNEILLTATEYKILTLFMNSPNRIFSKMQISNHINGEYFENDNNSITVHIFHLRDKIGLNENNNKYIVTAKGLGYKIENK